IIIGALKPFLRKMRTASRPSTSGRPTSIITRSICPFFAACTPFVPLSTAMASNSSCNANCSTNASRSSASSSTIRIVRLLAIVPRPLQGRKRCPYGSREIEHSTLKEQAGTAIEVQEPSNIDAKKVLVSYHSTPQARRFKPRLAHSRNAGAAGRNRARRHQGQQTRRRWWHATRHFSATAALVARRQASAARHLVAGATNKPGRCLVRRPYRPQIQSTDQNSGQHKCGPTVAYGQSL